MTKRAQFFTFEIYPDSAPKDWLEILEDWHIPMYISLHDKDWEIDEKTGEKKPKKAHYHILVMFDSLKALDVLDELIKAVNGVKPPLHKFVVQNKRSMARYLSHMDEDGEKKYLYYLDVNHKVIAIGGAESYDELCRGAEETRKAELNMVVDIQDYCERREITNVATLLRILRDHENYEWIDALRKNSYFWAWWFRSYKDEKETPLGPVSRKIEYLRNQKNKEEKNDESND